MNQKTRPPSSYSKQPNSNLTSPRYARRIIYCHKTTGTENHPRKDQICQTDPVIDQPLERNYMEALRYINECHEVMNEMYQQTKTNLRIPEVPNFIDMYMQCNSSKRSLTEIAKQGQLQQNISQTQCTLIDSPHDGSVNYQESSPETDYEPLIEPLKTCNKNQADIKHATKCHVNGDQDTHSEDISLNEQKHLDVLYANNVNWRISDHRRMSQPKNLSSNNVEHESRTNKEPQDKVKMSTLDFEHIVEELAQHASRKYNKDSTQQTQGVEQRQRLLEPTKCKHQNRNHCPYRGETKESSDTPSDQIDHSEIKPTLRQHNNQTDHHHQCESRLTKPINKTPVNYMSHTYDDLPPLKLPQKNQHYKAELIKHDNNMFCTNDRRGDRITCQADVPSPNSLEKLTVCKKKRSKDAVRKQYSDSDIDDEYFNEACLNKNAQRGCVNATEERRAIVRPNKTELISTVKYGRKVVMRTELAPSEHPNFRQQRQTDGQEHTKCGGDSSDISSDPEFIRRQ